MGKRSEEKSTEVDLEDQENLVDLEDQENLVDPAISTAGLF
jgi:hypothetical protein